MSHGWPTAEIKWGWDNFGSLLPEVDDTVDYMESLQVDWQGDDRRRNSTVHHGKAQRKEEARL